MKKNMDGNIFNSPLLLFCWTAMMNIWKPNFKELHFGKFPGWFRGYAFPVKLIETILDSSK
jgi:hypothetical protein